MDTLLVGNFFFFLAKSSMVDVGSEPGVSKNRIGTNF
jgi:hypothetical protein